MNVYKELLTDLQTFIRERVGNTITLNIPTFYLEPVDTNDTTIMNADNMVPRDPSVLVVEDLARYKIQIK